VNFRFLFVSIGAVSSKDHADKYEGVAVGVEVVAGEVVVVVVPESASSTETRNSRTSFALV